MLNRHDYDIVIVGAGPAGCIFAHNAPSDLNILLIDQSQLPRDKPCGGMLVEETKGILNDLQLSKSIFSKPETLDLVYWDWDNEIKVREKRNFYNISRQKFDYWLLTLLEEGIEVLPQTRLTEFNEKDDEIKLIVQKGGETRTIKTKYLIGADGALSTIRRGLGIKTVNRYTAFQEWVKLEGEIKDACFIYDSSITNFYSWLIPKKEYLIVGSALENNIHANFKKYKEKLKKCGLKIDPIKTEAHLIVRPESREDIFLGKNNVLLIGEAAGLISSSTGEGISFALRSGVLAASAFKEKDVLNFYKKSTNTLVDEVVEKIEKGKILSDQEKRKELFQKIKNEE